MKELAYNITIVLSSRLRRCGLVFSSMDEGEMEPGQIRLLINKILADVEEEDIGISLLSRQYQNSQELSLFSVEDQDKILRILERLSKDSERHKQMLQELVEFLGEKLHG